MTVLQAVGADNGAGATSVSATIASSSAGSILYAFVGIQSGTNATGATDNLSQGGWTEVTGTLTGESNYPTCFYIENTSSGVTTVTVNFGSSVPSALIVVEEDGVLTSGAFDKSNFSTWLSSSATWDTGSTATTSQDNEVVYALCASNGDFSTSTIQAPSGYSNLTGTGITNSGRGNTTDVNVLNVWRKVVSAIGAQSASGNCSPSVNNASGVVTFKLMAAGPAPRIIVPMVAVQMR